MMSGEPLTLHVQEVKRDSLIVHMTVSKTLDLAGIQDLGDAVSTMLG